MRFEGVAKEHVIIKNDFLAFLSLAKKTSPFNIFLLSSHYGLFLGSAQRALYILGVELDVSVYPLSPQITGRKKGKWGSGGDKMVAPVVPREFPQLTLLSVLRSPSRVKNIPM